MTQKEHLEAIVAKCNALLAIAAKRTPGTWVEDWGRIRDQSCDTITIMDGEDCFAPKWKANKRFIASTAGPFEASLIATIAAIESLQQCADDSNGRDFTTFAADIGINRILAAWPHELL